VGKEKRENEWASDLIKTVKAPIPIFICHEEHGLETYDVVLEKKRVGGKG